MKNEDGYRPFTGNGCTVRADVVDVYIFREREGRVEFLQLKRTREPLAGTWHPVMGHCEGDETAVRCAIREVLEETALDVRTGSARHMWALEQTYPFFIHQINTVVLSPRFAVEVSAEFVPTINDEHSDFRWVDEGDAESTFLWSGQKMAVREILSEFARSDSETSQRLRIDLDSA